MRSSWECHMFSPLPRGNSMTCGILWLKGAILRTAYLLVVTIDLLLLQLDYNYNHTPPPKKKI